MFFDTALIISAFDGACNGRFTVVTDVDTGLAQNSPSPPAFVAHRSPPANAYSAQDDIPMEEGELTAFAVE